MHPSLPKNPSRYTRIQQEADKPSDDHRKPAERDRDRILYSSAFRRLAGVTQVVAADEGHVFHNRLTHSLRVAQLARRLAEKVQRVYPEDAVRLQIDENVAEAAGLAHDLGHPPFGHIAERVLDGMLTENGLPDGYEGNAQSFRIVTRLSLRDQPEVNQDTDLSKDKRGLNLTPATLDALLKYPWTRDDSDPNKKGKWGAYKSEKRFFDEARKGRSAKDTKRCPEAAIMDWADDVTYAVHDLEDFYRAGLIPLERLASTKDYSERDRFYEQIRQSESLKKKLGGELETYHTAQFEKVITWFPLTERYSGTEKQRGPLRSYLSQLIGNFDDALKLGAKGVQPIDKARRAQVEMLKLLTWVYVILSPSLATQQHGQKKVVRHLFETFLKAGTKGDLSSIPLTAQEAMRRAGTNKIKVARVVSDLISGMTERQAVEIFRRLTGMSFGSVLQSISH